MSSTSEMPQVNTRPLMPGPDRTLVYLVRHGQTEWNLERRFQGQHDVPLSAEGISQAWLLADWLYAQQVKFGAVYTSDLQRASQTARVIGERLGLETRPVPALREIHAGEWQGLLSEEIEERYPGQLARWYLEANDFRLPGGETIPEVQARVLAWYREAVLAHRGQAIVVVSHGMAIRSLLAALEGWDVADTERMTRTSMGNTGVTALLADHVSGRSSILFSNSLVHLETTAGTSTSVMPAGEPATV